MKLMQPTGVMVPNVACKPSPINYVESGEANRYLANQLQTAGLGLEVVMLRWAAIFFLIALVAAVLGFSGIAASAAEIARIMFFVFLLIFVVTLIMGMIRK